MKSHLPWMHIYPRKVEAAVAAGGSNSQIMGQTDHRRPILKRVARLALPLAAAVAFVSGTGLVSAASTIYAWPPYGWSQQGSFFPYENFGIFCTNAGYPWVHSFTSHVFDGGSSAGLYIEYTDVYDGIAADPDVYWNYQEIYGSDQDDYSFQDAPFGQSFDEDWSEWYYQYWDYNIGSEEVIVDTYFGDILSGGCEFSTIVYRH